MIATVGHVEPVQRRIRAYPVGEKVLGTTRALYVWEWPHYPQCYIPLTDVRRDLLIPEGHSQQTRRGTFQVHALRAGEVTRPSSGSNANSRQKHGVNRVHVAGFGVRSTDDRQCHPHRFEPVRRRCGRRRLGGPRPGRSSPRRWRGR